MSRAGGPRRRRPTRSHHGGSSADAPTGHRNRLRVRRHPVARQPGCLWPRPGYRLHGFCGPHPTPDLYARQARAAGARHPLLLGMLRLARPDPHQDRARRARGQHMHPQRPAQRRRRSRLFRVCERRLGPGHHFTTSPFRRSRSPFDPMDLRPGDALNKPGSHVMLFLRFTPDRKAEVMESSPGACNGRVCRNVYPLSSLLARATSRSVFARWPTIPARWPKCPAAGETRTDGEAADNRSKRSCPLLRAARDAFKATRSERRQTSISFISRSANASSPTRNGSHWSC